MTTTSTASPPPDADAFAAPGSTSAELLQALKSGKPPQVITASLLTTVSETALFHLLPLLLSSLQLVGECTEDPQEFTTVLQAFRRRLLCNRVLKLRFLLHTKHPAFKAYWNVATEYNDNCYDAAAADEGEQDVDDSDLGSRAIEIREFSDDDPDTGTTDEGPIVAEDETAEDDETVEDDVDTEIADGNDELIAEKAFNRKCVKQVVMRIPVDTVDDQSVTFWREDVYAGDVEDGHQYSCGAVANPFFRGDGIDIDEEGHSLGELGPSASIGETVTVRKVFSSIARPKIVAISAQSANDAAEDSDTTDVPPGVLVKTGDNLMQDLGVEQMFQLFNQIWAQDDFINEQFEKPPVSVWYDVMPTDIEYGLMQAVGGLQSLKAFSWKAWQEEHGDNEDMISEMVRSAAGSYIATYIMG